MILSLPWGMDIRAKVIRTAHANPELRGELLPLVTRTAASGDKELLQMEKDLLAAVKSAQVLAASSLNSRSTT